MGERCDIGGIWAKHDVVAMTGVSYPTNWVNNGGTEFVVKKISIAKHLGCLMCA